jgi:hypothetical protein
MKISLIQVMIFAFIACNNNKHTSSEKISDSIKVVNGSIRKSRIEFYKLMERRAIDSLQQYNIVPFYVTYRDLLYKNYGTAILKEVDSGKSITVGECDIRLTGFSYVSPELRLISFDMFGTDSLPVPSDRYSREGWVMMLFAEINVIKKTITRASTGYMGYNPFTEFKESAESPQNLNRLQIYADSLNGKLHPNFKIALGLN